MKTMLRVESLEHRALLSASPWGEFAAPAPEPEPVTGLLSQGRVRLSTSSGATPAIQLENVLVSGVQVEPTAKIVVRWEKIAVPVVEEGGAAGGIISEGQGYGIAVATRGPAGGIVSQGQGYGI